MRSIAVPLIFLGMSPGTLRQIVAWGRKPQVRIPSRDRAFVLDVLSSAAREAGGRILPGNRGSPFRAAIPAVCR